MFRLDELSRVLTYSTVADSIPTTQPNLHLCVTRCHATRSLKLENQKRGQLGM